MKTSKGLQGSLTVRLPARSLKLLKKSAAARRVTASEVLRDLIDREFGDAPTGVSAFDLSQAWVGAVSSRDLPAGARTREALAEWSPDRR